MGLPRGLPKSEAKTLVCRTQMPKTTYNCVIFFCKSSLLRINQLFGESGLFENEHQRHPQSRHTPHGGSEKPTQRERYNPGAQGLGVGSGSDSRPSTVYGSIFKCALSIPPPRPAACYLPLLTYLLTPSLVTSPPSLSPPGSPTPRVRPSFERCG